LSFKLRLLHLYLQIIVEHHAVQLPGLSAADIAAAHIAGHRLWIALQGRAIAAATAGVAIGAD
jgi:hypothetical protein